MLVLREDFGIDMSAHRSSLLTQTEVDEAEVIIGVSAGHKAWVLENFSNCGKKVCNLKHDVSDPWHGPVKEYRACAHQLAELIPDHLSSLFTTTR